MFHAPLTHEMVMAEHRRRLAEATRAPRDMGPTRSVAAVRHATGTALVRLGQRLGAETATPTCQHVT